MFTKLAALALALPAAGTIALLSADYVIVDVREHHPGGVRLSLPVPISLVQTALAFAPEDARRVELPPEAARHAPAARALVAELRRQPDFELARIEEAGERVRVAKEGDTLRVDVEERDGQRVHVSLPLASAAEMLLAFDGRRLSTSAALDALRHAKGEVVHVVDADTEIRVRVF